MPSTVMYSDVFLNILVSLFWNFENHLQLGVHNFKYGSMLFI